MSYFQKFLSFKNIQLPTQSYFLGFLLSISFGLFYECAVPGMGNPHHGEANKHMHQMDVKDLAKIFDDPARDKWQKPDLVTRRIQKEIQDSGISKPVLWEIGAGSGYFSTKFIKKGWIVVAADPNPEFLNILKEKKNVMSQEEKARFIIQKIPYDRPAIHRKDVHLVFSSNTYHHIDNRPDYFREVRNSLAKIGSLMIVDFEKGKEGMGPPQNMRFTPQEVIAELKKAGFSQFDVDSKSFPYQFLLIAK